MEDGKLSELLADETEAWTEEVFMEGALKEYVRELLEALPERERYGLDGGGCASLAEIGVTRERVRQIQSAALRRLRARALEARLDSFLQFSDSPYLSVSALAPEPWRELGSGFIAMTARPCSS